MDNSKKIKPASLGQPVENNPPLPEKDTNSDHCFSPDLIQDDEKRVWSKIEELNQIPALVKESKLDEALEVIEACESRFADFDFIYAWKANIHHKKGNINTARQILMAGLSSSVSKHLICDRLGFLESQTGDIESAVQWWIKSIVLMSRNNRDTLWEPFLYLAHIAGSIGCDDQARVLMAAANKACIPGDIDLTPEAAKRLSDGASELINTWVGDAIKRLCNTLLTDPTHGPDTTGQAPPKEPKKQIDIIPNPRKNKMRVRVIFFILLAAAAIIFVFFFNQEDSPSPVRVDSLPEEPDVTAPVISEPDPVPATPADKPVIKKAAPAEKKSPLPETLPTVIPPVSDTKKQPQAVTPAPAPLVPHKKRPSYMKQKTKQPETSLKKKAP